jgi:hypothetical protein
VARLTFEPRTTQAGNEVPPCTFYALLVVLANAAADALQSPVDAVRIVAMAVQLVAERLPKRHKEELERSEPTAPSERWCRLRLRYTKRDLKVLRQAVWSQIAQPAPLGPAMRELLTTIDMVMTELNAAYERALPLGDEVERPKVEALPELDLPDDNESDGPPRNVNYDDVLEDRRLGK